MKTAILTATTIIICLTGSFGFGDEYRNGSHGYAIRPMHNGTPAVYHHASTYEEGLLRGQADWIRACGDYLYSTSLAMINGEEARRRYIDNRQHATKTYFEMRKLNRESLAQERGPRPTEEDVARRSKMRAPDRLGTHELDATFGVLRWPSVLKGHEFQQERTVVNRLMEERTVENSGLGSDNCRQVKQVVSQLEEKLKDRIDSVSPSEYVAGKKFLAGLSYEAQQKPGIPGLALK